LQKCLVSIAFCSKVKSFGQHYLQCLFAVVVTREKLNTNFKFFHSVHCYKLDELIIIIIIIIIILIIIIVIIIFINCNLVVIRWQWLCYIIIIIINCNLVVTRWQWLFYNNNNIY